MHYKHSLHMLSLGFAVQTQGTRSAGNNRNLSIGPGPNVIWNRLASWPLGLSCPQLWSTLNQRFHFTETSEPGKVTVWWTETTSTSTGHKPKMQCHKLGCTSIFLLLHLFLHLYTSTSLSPVFSSLVFFDSRLKILPYFLFSPLSV